MKPGFNDGVLPHSPQNNKAFDGPSSAFDAVEEAALDPSYGRDDNGIATGNDRDAFDMARMGRKQMLSRNFHSLSVLGLATTSMATWATLIGTSIFSLINGGRGGTVWLVLASWMCILSVVLSLAELASMAPTSGVQYHWVSEFAPPQWQKPLSYVVGWLSALSWQAIIAGPTFGCASTMTHLAELHHPSYQSQNWHNTLIMILVGLIATAFNTFGAKKLPLIEGLIMYFYVFGLFAIIIPLWVLAPKASASDVFGEFVNLGGWPSQGTACFVGTLTATTSFAGSDAAAHLSEEVKDASSTVPRMMIETVLLNGAAGMVFIITYCFCITDLEAVAFSTADFPYIDASNPFCCSFALANMQQVFMAATGSKAGGTAMAVIIPILGFFTTLNALAAASRQVWALSRDNGVPFSSWLQKVVTVGVPIPLNAIVFSLSILVILSLINLGSTTAFNSIAALLTSASAFSYIISIGCIFHKRLSGQKLPPARFSLGKFGAPINAFAICYTIVSAVASFFPLTLPVDASSMNWSVAIFAAVMGIAVTDYMLRGRKVVVPPIKRVHQE